MKNFVLTICFVILTQSIMPCSISYDENAAQSYDPCAKIEARYGLWHQVGYISLCPNATFVSNAQGISVPAPCSKKLADFSVHLVQCEENQTTFRGFDTSYNSWTEFQMTPFKAGREQPKETLLSLVPKL